MACQSSDVCSRNVLDHMSPNSPGQLLCGHYRSWLFSYLDNSIICDVDKHDYYYFILSSSFMFLAFNSVIVPNVQDSRKRL